MHAVILCPGPSIAAFDGGDFEGLLIGVNRAAILRRVDVWACGDQPAIVEFGPTVIGSPTLLAAANSAAWTRDHGCPWRGEVIEFEDLFGYLPHTRVSWTLFTFLAAIVLAASRGATQIDCYGADWKGEADADGVLAGGNRSAERWRMESEIFRLLQKVLHERGVFVHRILAD